MRVDGERAPHWTAVSLASLKSVEGTGTLTAADDETGEVRWTDRTGTACSASLGPHAIRLVVRGR